MNALRRICITKMAQVDSTLLDARKLLLSLVGHGDLRQHGFDVRSQRFRGGLQGVVGRVWLEAK